MSTPLPPDGWQYEPVKQGGILRDDDEYPCGASWYRTSWSGAAARNGKYRRKAWRQLGPDEILQQGDEFWSIEGAWEPFQFLFGSHARDCVSVCRRRIEVPQTNVEPPKACCSELSGTYWKTQYESTRKELENVQTNAEYWYNRYLAAKGEQTTLIEIRKALLPYTNYTQCGTSDLTRVVDQLVVHWENQRISLTQYIKENDEYKALLEQPLRKFLQL